MSTAAFEHLRREMTGYMQTSVLAAAAELDVCTVILCKGNSLDAAALAKECSCDERGMTVLLDALAAMKYLSKNGNDASARYSVAQEYTEYLDSRSPCSFIPMMRHMACGLRSWSRLTWTVMDGKQQERIASPLGAEQDRVSFIMGMNSIAVTLAPGTIDALHAAGVLHFERPNPRILDIGGASGTYTEAFLRKLPDCAAVIFDLPVGIAQARKRFDSSEFGSRVTLVEGDFTKDALPEGCDFAWISAIIHQMNREESRALYAKAHAALNPGGVVAVRDYVMDQSRTFPPDGALFGVNMLVNTPRGMVYTFDEIRQDLEASGFAQVKQAVDVPSMSAVVTARKIQ